MGEATTQVTMSKQRASMRPQNKGVERPLRRLITLRIPLPVPRLDGHSSEESQVTYVIVEACIGVKDRACVDVCPVDCIYEGEDQLYIHPDECIDCGACEPECPVTAIFPEEDVPPQFASYIEKNKEVFNSDSPPGRPKR
jgi:NAD-dependent dihydropyrimidine dehydrogenase PreA subunit